MSETTPGNDRLTRIEARLTAAFEPEAISVEDESHLHVGHAGARDGRGHFRVMLVSAAFRGQGLVARHRAVYQALGEMLQTDIHALSLDLHADDEL